MGLLGHDSPKLVCNVDHERKLALLFIFCFSGDILQLYYNTDIVVKHTRKQQESGRNVVLKNSDQEKIEKAFIATLYNWLTRL